MKNENISSLGQKKKSPWFREPDRPRKTFPILPTQNFFLHFPAPNKNVFLVS